MAGTVLSVYVFVLTSISGTTSDISSLKTNDLCTVEGGVCQNTYDGCKTGIFLKQLCPGPVYWQCCVKPPPEITTPAPWRMCYECSYSVFDGKSLGQKNCYKFENDTIGSPLAQVNCSNECAKEWLRLDKENFQLIRRCANDCKPFSVFSAHSVHCCHGDLCNSSWSNHVTCLPFLIRIVALLFMTIIFGRTIH